MSSNTKNTEVKSSTTYNEKVLIQCSIRRRLGQVGLPGADPRERIYTIGSSLDTSTRKALKGVVGKLETMLMPPIIGVSANDASFRKEIEQYWSDIRVTVPVDEDFLKEYEKGKVIKLEVILKQSGIKAKLQQAKSIEEKVEVLKDALIQDKAELLNNSVSDFLLLTYCLKYSRVANSPDVVDKSKKIHFYIYNKTTAVKTRFEGIKTRTKAVKLFEKVQDDERMLDAILIQFDMLPTDFEDSMDKAIEVDKKYNESPSNMMKFISAVENENWETIYLIKMACKKGKLNNPANTETYYYNQLLLGKTIEDAVLFLNSDQEEAKNIKLTLEKEIKI